jgi:Ca-activated chloride channel family protein
MSFTWPLALLLLLLVPALLAAYLLALRRRRRRAITYSSIALLRTAVSRGSRWRRHMPIAALLASIAVLGVASARPQITSDVPAGKTAIILALDESGSMCSTDVLPDRLSVAQSAAREFVDSRPSGTSMGLVEFSGFAELAVAPTQDRSALDRAIDNLTTGPGTAIGAAMLQSLDAISEFDPQVKPIGSALSTGAAEPAFGGGTDGSPGAPAATAQPKPPKGGYVPDIVVLLTDGANNRGLTPLQAVPYAVSRRVRVYTIGFGTTHPGPLACTPKQQGGVGFGGGFGGGGFGAGGFGGGGFAGGGFQSPLVADLPPLREVSRLTGAQSYTARTGAQLNKVFANLQKHVAVAKERHEVTADFALLGAILALVALGASARWSSYP